MPSLKEIVWNDTEFKAPIYAPQFAAIMLQEVAATTHAAAKAEWTVGERDAYENEEAGEQPEVPRASTQ